MIRYERLLIYRSFIPELHTSTAYSQYQQTPSCYDSRSSLLPIIPTYQRKCHVEMSHAWKERDILHEASVSQDED